jgi:Protein of unknown function (DUF3085)
MAKFIFDGTAVRELLTHAKAAPKTTSPYNLTDDPGPGLFFVKDEGVYLMSNGEPPLPGAESRNKVVYARGYEALAQTASLDDRMERYDKVRDAAGGDDFAEFLPAKSLEKLEQGGLLEINLTPSKLRICIIGKAPDKQSGKSGRPNCQSELLMP